jgi:hypothetical protein
VCLNRRDQPRPDPRDPIKRRKAAERTVGFTIDDDGPGESEANPWETGDLHGGCPIEVDPLPGTQGPHRGEA